MSIEKNFLILMIASLVNPCSYEMPCIRLIVPENVSKNNVSAIIGGSIGGFIFGVLTILAIVAAIFVYKRKANDHQPPTPFYDQTNPIYDKARINDKNYASSNVYHSADSNDQKNYVCVEKAQQSSPEVPAILNNINLDVNDEMSDVSIQPKIIIENEKINRLTYTVDKS